MIKYEDFQKIELRIAKVIHAEKITTSEKLLKLIIDIGQEKRQIVAGIAKEYSPDQLIGKEIVVIANLEPKKIMGIDSQGMLLAAKFEEKPVLLIPEKEVAPGSRVS